MRRTLRSTFAVVGSAVAIALAAGAGPAAAAVRDALPTGPAYFEMTDVTHHVFVIEMTKPGDIEHARELLRGETTDRPHVIGRIVKRPAGYNRRWSYHVAPESAGFFDFAIEVCDATIPYVQEHLDEAGGAFLPGLVWCDWSSRLVREIPAP
jgi:hypothetical protein